MKKSLLILLLEEPNNIYPLNLAADIFCDRVIGDDIFYESTMDHMDLMLIGTSHLSMYYVCMYYVPAECVAVSYEQCLLVWVLIVGLSPEVNFPWRYLLIFKEGKYFLTFKEIFIWGKLFFFLKCGETIFS
jgi:hypothetical protein